MYSVRSYGDMIEDAARTDAYVEALRRTVKPGCVVLDIGTGVGLFAVVASRLGARRVYAVEQDDIIDVARRIAAANGCSAIEFIQASSTDITLPERADVIVSDLHGCLPFYEAHLVAVADARRRLLAPGGTLVPRSETLWLAGVEAAEWHRAITTPWRDNRYGLDLNAGGDLVANQWRRVYAGPKQLVTEPQCFGAIDYSTVENPDFDAKVVAPVTRATTAHGLCVWFDALLAEGVGFSNAPGHPDSVYSNAFFPWPDPVALQPGDMIEVTLAARLTGEDYLWKWETSFSRRGSELRAPFRQSSFFAKPLSRATLRKQSAEHIATLNDQARVDALVLKLMAEGHSLGSIAERLATEFPARFARRQDAMARVGELSARYSR